MPRIDGVSNLFTLRTVFWALEMVFAILILVLEGLLEVLWFITPFSNQLQDLLVNRLWKLGSWKDPMLQGDFKELTASNGYSVEEHYVRTEDDYLLCMHRVMLPAKSQEKSTKPKKVVFLMHGCLMSSEVWVLREDALPFLLLKAGYDVWLGNTRGNKYSCYNFKRSTSSNEFWDYSLDELAFIDLPAMVNYVLDETKQPTLSYIGFSQGTALAFAALSTNRKFAEKVNKFVALGPATRIKKLNNPLVAAISTSNPQLLFTMMGKQKFLAACLFWRKVLAPPIYVFAIDRCLEFLFGWKLHNLNPKMRALYYAHLYSFMSVKAIIHWFQITHKCQFQMFDDNIRIDNRKKYYGYHIPTYEPSRVTCPIAMFYGGMDTIPDNNWLLEELKKMKQENVYFHKEDDYEHLDFLWADSAPERIFKKVLQQLPSPDDS